MRRNILHEPLPVYLKLKRHKQAFFPRIRNIAIALLSGLIIWVGVMAGLNRYYPLDLSRVDTNAQVLLDRKGDVLCTRLAQDGRWRFSVNIEELDRNFLKMLLTFEDKRFFYHPGIDPLALTRSLFQWITHGRVISGGSSITMQLARLLEPRPRNLRSKCMEILRAFQLEFNFTKQEILSLYLMLTPYGGNLEGVKAASLAYFGKLPQRLTHSEAAFLVALPQSPNQLRSETRSQTAQPCRDKVLSRMGSRGVLTKKQVKEAMEDKIPKARRSFPMLARHLIYRSWPPFHSSSVASKISQVKTTLDVAMQTRIEKLLKQEIPFLLPQQSVAVIVVDNKTRAVRAYCGSADFLDETRLGQIDMVHKIRSPGSLLKPFIYGMAFDEGFLHPETLMDDVPTGFSGYRPSNFKDAFHGKITLREALKQSLNIPAVAVLERLGPGRFYSHLRSLRITLNLGDNDETPALPIALGGVGMTLWDLVSLYCALPNHGVFLPLKILEDPNSLQELSNPPLNLISASSAWHISRILEETQAPEGFVDLNLTTSNPIAYKTGTSYGYRDAWAIGYNQDHTVGIWVGRADGTPSLPKTGRIAAAPLLFKIFDGLPHSEKKLTSKPDSILSKPITELPIALRYFNSGSMNKMSPLRTASQKTRRSSAHEPLLTILFPKRGALIPLVKSADHSAYDPVVLTISGGKPPFYCLINGKPVAQSDHSTKLSWQPMGPGFVNILVLDSYGQSSSIEIELVE